MTRYLISFNDGAMSHIADEDWPDVGKAAHAVVQEAVNAGVWVFGAGLERQRASVVAPDGMVVDGPYPETKEVIGGFSVVDVPSREEALVWAAKTAAACRCAQEVREVLDDPETDAMLRQAGRWATPGDSWSAACGPALVVARLVVGRLRSEGGAKGHGEFSRDPLGGGDLPERLGDAVEQRHRASSTN
jgi:hypothetical protein